MAASLRILVVVAQASFSGSGHSNDVVISFFFFLFLFGWNSLYSQFHLSSWSVIVALAFCAGHKCILRVRFRSETLLSLKQMNFTLHWPNMLSKICIILINPRWTDFYAHVAVFVPPRAGVLIAMQLDVLDSGSTQSAWPLTTRLEMPTGAKKPLQCVRHL